MRYGGKQGDCYRTFEGKKKNHMLVMITWQLHIQSQLAFFMLVTNLKTWKWSPMNEFVLKS
jgi:hypothetical protein